MNGRGGDGPAGEARDGSVELLRSDIRSVLAPYLAARLLVGVGLTLATAVAGRYYASGPAALDDGLMMWDGTWYRDIAERGYGGLPTESLRFFPLYPLSGRALGVVLRSDALALLLVANLCALALAVLVLRLMQFEAGDRQVAARASAFMMLFPSAFTLVLAYGEALMLAAAVGAFLAARTRRWWVVIPCALVASATRPVGAALVPALAIEACRGLRQAGTGERVARVLAVVAPGAGAGVYLLWVQVRFGNWRIPLDVQNDLRGQDVNPLTRIVHGIGDLAGPERFGDGLHVPFAIAFVVLLVVVFRRLPASYGAYASVVLVAALGAENLNSIERYALDAFPVVLALAIVARSQRAERLALAVCGCGFASLTALAFLGLYVP